MKIFFFIHVTGTDPGLSGIPRVVKNLGRELHARPDVELVPVFWSETAQAIVHANEHLLGNLALHGGPRIPTPALQGHPIMPSNGDWLLVAEVPHLRSHNRDYPSVLVAQPLAYARRVGIRSALIFHDILPLLAQAEREQDDSFRAILTDSSEFDPEENERLRFALYAAGTTLADVVLPVSATSGMSLRNWLLQQGWATLPRTVPVMLPEEVYGVSRKIPADVPRQSGGPIEFLTVGTVFPHKNQIAVMKAFNNLCAKRPDLNLKLHVVGSVSSACATQVSILAKRSGGRIVLHGYLPDERLSEIWDRIRASVFVSFQEGYGLPIAESLWFGKPCLCSDRGSMAEIAADGGCVLANPFDLADIEGGLLTLATDEKRYRRLLGEIRERSLRDWKDYASAVLSGLATSPAVRVDRTFLPKSLNKNSKVDRRTSHTERIGLETGYIRDESGNSIRLPTSLPAASMRVHEAYEIDAKNKLRNGAGILFDQRVHGENAEMTLFFGPYLRLEPGRYTFRFRGELKGYLRVRLAGGYGKEVLLDVRLRDFSRPLSLEIVAPISKFEIIGERTSETAKMALSSIEIERREAGHLGFWKVLTRRRKFSG